MTRGGRISVHPNPAEAGKPVTITYTGGGGSVMVNVDGEKEPTEVPLDENGEATIPTPTGAGNSFTVSDAKVPPSSVNVEVYSP